MSCACSTESGEDIFERVSRKSSSNVLMSIGDVTVSEVFALLVGVLESVSFARLLPTLDTILSTDLVLNFKSATKRSNESVTLHEEKKKT